MEIVKGENIVRNLSVGKTYTKIQSTEVAHRINCNKNRTY